MSARHLFALALACAGCGESAFSTHARDNAVDDIRRALAASRPANGAQSGHALAFLLTTGGPGERQLVGYDLAGAKVLWSEKADVRSRIIVGRGLVAHRQGDAELVGRDPQSGHVKLTVHLRPDEKYVGAAVDDERLYYVVQSTGGSQRMSSTVAVDAGGHELWRVPVQGSLAAPAARGGVVAVPYAQQNVVFLDAMTGKELARVRATDEQLSFVRALPDGFFYGGSRGVYLFDEKSANGSRKDSSYVEANLGSDQIRTFYYWDGYQLAQADYSAFDRNRLLWRGVVAGGGLHFADDVTVLHSFRYFFALDAKTGKLRWAYAHPRVDMVSADFVGPVVAYAGADGEIGAIDVESGAVRASLKTGLRLAGATFDAEGWSGGAVSEKPDLLKTLEQIVWDHDARFTAVKVFSVGAIGATPGTDATAALLRIVRAPSTGVQGVPPAVQKRAGDELVARKDAAAAPLFLDALKQHDDYLTDEHPHGIDVLARALTAVAIKDAAPALASHLANPATPQSALREINAALVSLGGKDALRALRAFLLTYRADPGFLMDPSPLTIAGEGLLTLGGPEELRLVEFVVGDKRTLAPVARYLQKAMDDRAK